MKFERVIVFMISLLAMSLSSFAQGKVSLFIYGDIENSDKFILESKISEQLSKHGSVSLLCRTQDYQDMLTDEIVFQNSGEVDGKEMCKLGKKWGASYIIGIMAVETRGLMVLTSKLINVATGEELFTISNHKEIKRPNDVFYLGTLMGTNISSKLKGIHL